MERTHGDDADAAPGPVARGDFVVAQDGRVRLVVDPRFEAALRGLGFADADRLGALADALVPDRTRAAGRGSTQVFETPQGPVFVKRALKGGALGPLFAGRIPRFSRVAHEIEVTAVLRDRGAPVLEPVAAAGVRDAFGWRALVATAFVPDAVDGATALARALAARPDGPAGVASLARRLGVTLRAFHDAGGHHADLAVTNLLVAETSESVTVVDLQGAVAAAPPSSARRDVELARLRRSIERRPDIRPALDVGWDALLGAYRSPIAR